MGLFDFFKGAKTSEAKHVTSDTEGVVFFDSTGRIIGNGIDGFKQLTDGNQKPSFYEIAQSAYGQSPWVYIVVDRIAKACMKMMDATQLVNMEGEPISPRMRQSVKVRELERLLSQPQSAFNRQSMKKIVYSIISNYLLTGNGYFVGFPINQETPTRYTDIISPLSQYVDPNDDGQAKLSFYTINYYNLSFTVFPKDVMHMSLPNLIVDEFEGHSAMQSLVNIWKANNAINSNEQFIHERKGANGVLYSEGNRPMTPDERKQMQKQMDADVSGRDRVGRYTYLPQKVGYIDLSKSFKELQANETKDAQRETIAAAYNYPVELLNDTTSSTYNNKKLVKRDEYKDAVLPVFDFFLSEFNKWCIKGNYGLSTVKLGYLEEDVPELQLINSDKTDDNTKKTDMVVKVNEAVSGGNMTRASGINTLIIAGGFTEEEAVQLIIKPAEEGTSSEEEGTAQVANAEAQAALRGSVGGVQGILAIQQSVANGVTEYSAALQTLIIIYGFDEAEARSVLGDVPNTNNNTNNELD